MSYKIITDEEIKRFNELTETSSISHILDEQKQELEKRKNNPGYKWNFWDDPYQRAERRILDVVNSWWSTTPISYAILDLLYKLSKKASTSIENDDNWVDVSFADATGKYDYFARSIERYIRSNNCLDQELNVFIIDNWYKEVKDRIPKSIFPNFIRGLRIDKDFYIEHIDILGEFYNTIKKYNPDVKDDSVKLANMVYGDCDKKSIEDKIKASAYGRLYGKDFQNIDVTLYEKYSSKFDFAKLLNNNVESFDRIVKHAVENIDTADTTFIQDIYRVLDRMTWYHSGNDTELLSRYKDGYAKLAVKRHLENLTTRKNAYDAYVKGNPNTYHYSSDIMALLPSGLASSAYKFTKEESFNNYYEIITRLYGDQLDLDKEYLETIIKKYIYFRIMNYSSETYDIRCKNILDYNEFKKACELIYEYRKDQWESVLKTTEW